MAMMKIQSQIDSIFDSLSVDSFGSLADSTIRDSFDDLLTRLNADAGALWIVEHDKPDELTIAVNVGARGSTIEGNVSQGLDTGLVSRAYREKELVHDQGAFRHPEQSMDVDMQLGQFTAYQIACPFQMFDKTIGAVTVIQLSSAENATTREWGFQEEDVTSFTRWISVAQQLFEYARLRSED
ncbi:MAG: hypothetical protein AAF456_01425 [Planctomycetota bacterium]